MENKSSNNFEYSIFTNRVFNKPDKYLLGYRMIYKKWWYRFVFGKSEWNTLSEDGTGVRYGKKPFITESKEEIQKFMDWNIKKDNGEL